MRGFELVANNCIKNLDATEIFKQKSEQLIPKLANIALLPQYQPLLPFILGVIQGLSKYATPAYLDRVFLKNLEKLEKNMHDSIFKKLRNFDILLSIANEIEIKDKMWGICLNFIKEMIKKNNILQKKGYKLLNIIIDKVHESFHLEVLKLMKEFQGNVLSFSREMRLNCLRKIWNSLSQENYDILQEILPEIVLSLKENKVFFFSLIINQ